MGPQIVQVVLEGTNKSRQGARFLRSRKTLKHKETSSGLDIRFVYVLHCFAFSNFNGVMVARYMFFLVFAVAPNTSRNTKRIDPSKSSERQNGAHSRPSGAKMSPFFILIIHAPLCVHETECSQDPPETPRGLICDDA